MAGLSEWLEVVEVKGRDRANVRMMSRFLVWEKEWMMELFPGVRAGGWGWMGTALFQIAFNIDGCPPAHSALTAGA